MKKPWLVSAGMAFILGFTFKLHAQSTAPDSIVQLAAQVQGLNPVSPSDLPEYGTFWLITSNGVTVPDPAPLFDPSLPVYQITDDEYLVDATDGEVATEGEPSVADAVESLSNAVVELINQVQTPPSQPMTRSRMAGGMMAMDDDEGGDDFTPDSSFDTNSLYLQIMDATNGQADLILNNATDEVYEVMSKTDLSVTNWTIETEVWPTNSTAMPFSISEQDRTNLFIWAMDWTGVTENGNTTPDWWFYYWFGTTDLSDTNLDSSGNTLLSDYENDLDPNPVPFTLQFTNSYFNANPAYGTITISSGTPFYEAVLINDTNLADANWQPYTSSNLAVTFSSNGTYNVFVGLRGLPTNSLEMWMGAQLIYDTVPPTLAITNPASGTVSVPTIQLQGYANESLSSLTFDVSNATGIFSNQTGCLTGNFYDTNLVQFTTNYFQCYDVALTNGLNVITLHATDMAGNTTTTNFSYTLSYAGVTNPPALTLLWPPDGAQVSGDNFTVQAQLDDATATVTASITDTNGDTSVVQGLVERSGAVWVKNLPLNGGTNEVTLTATNAAGLGSATNFDVVQSAVTVTVDPLPANELNQALVTVTGTVSDSSYDVWVNGVQATVSGDPTWEADNVPVSPTGTASFTVEVGMNLDNPLAGKTIVLEQPSMVQASGYQQKFQDQLNFNGDSGHSFQSITRTASWAIGAGGYSSQESVGFPGEGDVCDSYVAWPTNWPNGETLDGESCVGDYSESPNPAWQYASIPVQTALYTARGDDGPETWDYQLSLTAQTRIELVAGGGQGGAPQLIRLLVSAASYSALAVDLDGPGPAYFTENAFDGAGDTPILASAIQIMGQTLMPTATNAYVGETFVTLPAGAVQTFAPTVTSALNQNYYSYNVQPQDVQLHILANGYDLSVTNPEFCVGQAVTNQLVFDPPLPTNTVVTYQWSASLDFVNSALPPVNPDGSTYPDIDPTLLTNNPTLMWWYNGGNKYVFCTATVQLPNGQTATITAEGNVSIFQPQVEFTDGSPAYPMLYNDYMELGDESLQQGNMTFAAQVISTNNFYGTANWTQLNNREASYPNEGQDTDGEFWLDTSEFYNDGVGNDPPPTTVNPIGSIHFQDAPGVSDVYGFETITDSFKTYLVFQPTNSPNSIWVTLGIVTWGWSATESAFTLTATNVTQATYSVSDQFPTWVHTGTGSHN